MTNRAPPPAVTRMIIRAPVDLGATLDGGQAFRWRREGTGYRGVVGDEVVVLADVPGGIEVRLVNSGDFDAMLALARVREYLGVNRGFDEFRRRYRRDPVIGPALQRWPGLRVLRQDPWECLAAFIASAVSNVPRIKRNVNALARAFGRRVGEGENDFGFPRPATIADAGEAAMRRLGFGFRGRYIVAAARAVAVGALDLPALRRAPYKEARRELMALDGVGEKIADCVLGFSLDKPEAFPVDRWVRRALEEWYGMPSRLSVAAAGDWARQRFGRDAIYAQQYLFHRQRMTAARRAVPATRATR